MQLADSPLARLTEARFYALEKRMQLEENDRIESQVTLNSNMAVMAENVESVPKVLFGHIMDEYQIANLVV